MRYRYSQPALRKLLCAQYALGTLRGAARRRFEHLLPGDGSLRAELRWWDQRLSLLALRQAPIKPRDIVWLELRHRIEQTDQRTAQMRAPSSRRWAWLATAASVVLAIALFITLRQPPIPPQVIVQQVPVEVPAPQPFVAVLQPDAKFSAWMVTVTPKNGHVLIKTLRPMPVAAGHSMELWVIAGKKPVSMGVLPESGRQEKSWPANVPFEEGLVLAVSVEPAGGSPTGVPTGPVVTTGAIQPAI
jgi:anti-sigma-K factor RskA